jgi:epoxyqueuosine reductase
LLISNYLKNEITKKAQELGFCAIGFAKAEILEKESEYLTQWIYAGFASTMQWIEKGYEKRKDIRNVMKEAKSVICLAYNYYYPHVI